MLHSPISFAVMSAAQTAEAQHSAMVYDAQRVPRFARVAIVFDTGSPPAIPTPPHPSLTRVGKPISKPLTMHRSLMIFRFYRP